MKLDLKKTTHINGRKQAESESSGRLLEIPFSFYWIADYYVKSMKIAQNVLRHLAQARSTLSESKLKGFAESEEVSYYYWDPILNTSRPDLFS